MTNIEFTEQAKKYIGWGYAYGEKLGRKLTKEIVNSLIQQNGKGFYYFHNCTVEKWLGIRCIDCSGLICYILNQNGLMTQNEQLNTNAAKLYHSYCTPITKESLKPGDIVFRKTGSYIPHVGIYMGNGLTIEAKATSLGVCWGNVKDFNLFGRLKLLTEKKMDWKEIIKEATDKPTEWEKAIQKEIDANDSIFKYFPQLIEKIYNSLKL